MRHYFTKQCVTFGSALLLGLASGQAQAQTEPNSNRPSQKALISLESNFISRWMSGDKSGDKAAATTDASATPLNATTPAEPARKALLPPNSILNRNFPPATSPSAAATPLPPTTLVIGPAPASPLPVSTPIQQPSAVPLQQPIMLPGARPMVAPIGTTLPPGVAQAQLVAAQSPVVQGQAPVILVVPAGWQPDGSVTFAPRTIMSPEVPAEHWPTVERNPFGDRVDRGMFTWPKFAKQIAGATLDGQEVAPQGAPSKALFAASNKPAEVQPAAKALFAPAPAAPVAPPVPESRALFARQAAPVAKPAAEPAKSRALFSLGRKDTPVSETAATTQVADASVAPAAPAASQANSSATLDPAQAPPEAPNLSEFDAVPSAAAPLPTKQQTPKPAEKKTELAKPGMKWRAKGAPLTEAVTETVMPSSEPEAAEPAVPPTQIVKQVASAPAEESVPAETVGAAQPHAADVPATTAAQATTPAAANQKALFASSFFSRGTAPASHALAPSRLASPAPRATAPARPAEKALVPNLMAMIPGLKEAAMNEDATSEAKDVTPAAATEDASAPTSERISQASTQSAAATARLTQSYYAPAAEYPSQEPEVAKPPAPRQATPVATSNRRQANSRQAAEELDEPQVESMLEQPIVSHERHQAAIESQPARQPRQNQSSYGTPSNGARAAEQRTTKTYRRLTTKDLTAGLSRPLEALNQFTKLPPTVTRYTAEMTNADLEAFEQDARGRYAHNNDAAVTSHPPLKRTPVASRPSTRPLPEAKQRVSAAVVSDEEEDSPRETAPSVVRSGHRRVVAPAVLNEQVDQSEQVDDQDVQAEAREEEPAEPEVKATRVRNKSGASVLIYSGADLSRDKGRATRRTSSIEASDAHRGNPLR
jgi:hypothetical protein